jgi:hypothetical protein
VLVNKRTLLLPLLLVKNTLSLSSKAAIMGLMLRMSESLLNLPVISLRVGQPIATAELPIINPHNLKIIGWWCKPFNSNSLQILLTDDVRENLSQGLAINDEDALSPPEDLVRLKEVLDSNFQLADKIVKTKRRKIGKVHDFSYNDGLFVQKLYVARSLIKVFAAEDTAIIDRTQIIEITDSYILVRDSEIKEGEEELAGAAVPA